MHLYFLITVLTEIPCFVHISDKDWFEFLLTLRTSSERLLTLFCFGESIVHDLLYVGIFFTLFLEYLFFFTRRTIKIDYTKIEDKVRVSIFWIRIIGFMLE